MRNRTLGFTLLLISALCGCNKQAAPNTPQATVVLKDGSTFAGTVTTSSPSAITLLAASGESRTYPMTQVASVQYATDQTTPPSGQTASDPGAAPGTLAQPVTAPPPVEEVRTIPAGTNLEIRNNDAIDSQTASAGQTYSAVVARDVLDSNNRVAIPRGSAATLVVRSASDQGRLQGQSELMVDVGSVRVAGRRYRLDTSDVVEKGRQGVGTNARTAKFVGGGTALGTILGAVAGGGKGAAIGALSGAAAGTATQGLTRGKAVRIPPETLLRFRLEAPVDITETQ